MTEERLQEWKDVLDSPGEPGSGIWMSPEYVREIVNEVEKLKELLRDLNEILLTALHNGHHDLIQRVKEICK